jgi:hypothetical protein
MSRKQKKTTAPEQPIPVSNLQPDVQEIALRAYTLYEERGRRDGYAVEDWLKAEKELRLEKAAS